MFRKNTGSVDRAVRVLLGLTLLTLGWFGVVTGTLGLVFKVLGFLPLATGLAGWCPLYAMLGISTCRPRSAA
jgi:hypothetical protein